MKEKLLISGAVALSVVAIIFAWGARDVAQRSLGVDLNSPQPYSASTTAFTLTTSSQRLLGTSTRRIAAKIDSTNCTVSNITAIAANNDIAATATTGTALFSTSTVSFGVSPSQNPVPVGAVQGITNVGTCTVIVTEWRAQRP